MIDRKKVLIIKPGYSETLDPDTSGLVSLGDILRSTVLLHCFDPAEYHVTWVVDPLAWPLLRGNRRIDRVLKVNPFLPFHLMKEHFDVVVNLEKDPGICAWADSIAAWRRHGFRFDPRLDRVAGHVQAEEALDIASDPTLKRRIGRNWSEILYQMVGEVWRGENIVLGHYPDVEPKWDVGLNYRAGKKYPLKIWPMNYWHELANRLEADGVSVCWQAPQDNLDEFETYIDWIASCRVLVTNDTLGLHIAQALEKPAVALFGPTCATDIPDSPILIKIWSEVAKDCPPCLAASCDKPSPCMPAITVAQVHEAVTELLGKAHMASRARATRPRSRSSRAALTSVSG